MTDLTIHISLDEGAAEQLRIVLSDWADHNVGDFPAALLDLADILDIDLPSDDDDFDNCSECGRHVDHLQDAFTEDAHSVAHLDCNDPRGGKFGDDGMPIK